MNPNIPLSRTPLQVVHPTLFRQRKPVWATDDVIGYRITVCVFGFEFKTKRFAVFSRGYIRYCEHRWTVLSRRREAKNFTFYGWGDGFRLVQNTAIRCHQLEVVRATCFKLCNICRYRNRAGTCSDAAHIHRLGAKCGKCGVCAIAENGGNNRISFRINCAIKRCR